MCKTNTNPEEEYKEMQNLMDRRGWDIQSIKNARLEAILNFTHTLITKPISADKMALSALPKAGLSTPEVVTLAQLISFVSYQVRLAAGLRAMKALELAS
jgi:uncharacterized protein YciW